MASAAIRSMESPILFAPAGIFSGFMYVTRRWQPSPPELKRI